MKTQIEKYKVNGKVYAWTYHDNQRNFPGWNFTVDKKASENLIELLDLMKVCEWGCKKQIELELPTESQVTVPNNQNGMAKWKTKFILALNCIKNDSKNHWLILESDNKVEIQFGTKKLTELQKAIIGITKGEGDFTISDKQDQNILYIWWNLDK